MINSCTRLADEAGSWLLHILCGFKEYISGFKLITCGFNVLKYFFKMKKWNIIVLLLFLTSFIGYLEWGERKEFIFQMEFDILQKLVVNPSSIIHPLVVLPLIGQIILLLALFKTNTHKYLVLIGIFGIFLLFAMIFHRWGFKYKIQNHVFSCTLFYLSFDLVKNPFFKPKQKHFALIFTFVNQFSSIMISK
jgi:hypothetical protein